MNYRANASTTVGMVYTFRISARNLAAKSDSHPYLYAQASLQAPVLTAAPTLALPTLTATGQVRLSWTAVTPPAGTTISYIVNVNGVQLVRTNQLAYNNRPTLAQLQAGLIYTVQAVATAIRVANPTVYGSTTGPLSNAQPLMVVLPTTPATPTASALANAGGGNYNSTLSWAPAVTGATSYVIQPTLNGVAQAVINVAGGATVTRNVTLVAGNTYTYAVAAVDLAGTSLYSTPLTVNTPPAQSTTPAANLLATRSIAVAWTNVSVNITGFTIQRRLGAGAWTAITPAPTVTQNGTAYSITDTVTAAGSYTYRLLATSSGGSTVNTPASNAVVTP